MKKIAVLIPCYNEENTIAQVILDFNKELPEAEIYVFDNNSTDNSAMMAESNGAFVIKEPRQGKGNVVRSMFSKIDADIYVMVDADGTYPPSNVRELIAPVISGEADMVIGDRLSSTYFTENKRPFHNLGNRLVRQLINKLFKSDIHDVLTGYRAFNRNFVKSIAIQSTGFEIETELTVNALYYNFKVKEVVIPYVDRKTGSESKLNTFNDGLRIISTIFKLFRDYNPFLFFSSIAIVLAVIAIGFNIPVLIDYFHTGLVERFPTLFCGGFMMIAALLFFCAGMILQVISNQNKIIIDTINLKR